MSNLLEKDSEQSMDKHYKVKVGDCLISPSSAYLVKQILGRGTYGTVALCQKDGTNQMVAIKVLRHVYNDDVGTQDARILQMLQEGNSGHEHIVRCMDSFQHDGNYCHEFEKLDIDLSDFLESCPDMTLPLAQIRPIIVQMAKALQFLKSKGVIHCDLKPNNIMMTDQVEKPLHIKLIDFGLACPVQEVECGNLVQTFYYRAPEVQVGGNFTEAIDIWSVGCIAAEMFLGTFLFSAYDEVDLMRHVVKIVGQPPKHVLDSGKNTRMFFRRPKSSSQWICSRKLERQPIALTISSLDEIYENYPLNGETSPAENQDRRLFVDLLKHMLDVDLVRRYTPEDILNHPFITMSHLQHSFPLYYSKCQKIMDLVLDSSNEEEQPSTSSSPMQVCESAEATVATQSKKSSGKRSREEEEIAPRKRVRREAKERPQQEGPAPHDGSRGETSFTLQEERQSLKKRRRSNESEEEQRSISGFTTQMSEGAVATVETQGQTRKRSRDEEEEMPQKRLKNEDYTSVKSQRGDDRLKDEDTALQNRSRGETSFSQPRKEQRSSGKRRGSIDGEEGHNPPLPLLRRSAIFWPVNGHTRCAH